MEVRDGASDAKVVYDDDMEEWLDLSKERFQWLAPRACSAGATSDLQVPLLLLASCPTSPINSLAPVHSALHSHGGVCMLSVGHALTPFFGSGW